MITRDDLVRELAKVSHATWMRQAADDPYKNPNMFEGSPQPRDYQRAEDVVRALERLGVFPPGAPSTTPEPEHHD
jgi:hypothetical protein